MANKKEIIKYLFFGVLSTLVNIVFYQLFELLLGADLYLITNILSWIITIAFAFVTNKLWVFESKSWSFKVIRAEIISFLFARIFSLVLEEAGLFVLIDAVGLKEFNIAFLSGSLISKIIMQVIVVLSNYVFSKFFIFRKENKI